MKTKSLTAYTKTCTSASSELYFYYSPQLSYQAYDATIQGNMFKEKSDTKEINAIPEQFVINNQFGIDYSNKHFTIGIAATIQTKDVTSMKKTQHQWGSVTVSYLM